MEATTRPEIPPGTLYMLVLKTLSRLGSMHGYGIAQHIQKTSKDVLEVEECSLYPALQRMLVKGGLNSRGSDPEHLDRLRSGDIRAEPFWFTSGVCPA